MLPFGSNFFLSFRVPFTSIGTSKIGFSSHWTPKQQIVSRYFSRKAPNVNFPPPGQHSPMSEHVDRPGSETDEMGKKHIGDDQKVAETVETAADKHISHILEERFEHKQDIVERLGRVKEPSAKEIKETNDENMGIPIITLHRDTRDILRGEEFFADRSMNDSKLPPGDPLEYLYVQGKEEIVQKVMSMNDMYLQDAEERWKRDLHEYENKWKESASQDKISSSSSHERSLPSETTITKESIIKTSTWTSFAKEKIKEAKESSKKWSKEQKEQPKEDPNDRHLPPLGI